MNEDKSIIKNKRIILISILIFVTFIVVLILLNSRFNDDVYFHYVYNQNTGEQLSIITSLFLYLLFWWFVGGIPSACVFLFMATIYAIIHRKDKRLFEKSYHPKYEEELFYGGQMAFAVTYLAVLVLMILHLSNIATIRVF